MYKWLLLCEGQRDTGCHLPIFQSGLGRPVHMEHSSLQKAKAVLEGDNIKKNGKNTQAGLFIPLLCNAQGQ
jgi:hypothetical protein